MRCSCGVYEVFQSSRFRQLEKMYAMFHILRLPDRLLLIKDKLKTYLNSASTSSKWSKKPLKSCTPRPGSRLPIVARILCMLSCGKPASIARMPIADDSMGPTVPPDLTSFLIWKTCILAPHLSATRCRNAVLTLSVVVCPFGSAWMATPVFKRGE